MFGFALYPFKRLYLQLCPKVTPFRKGVTFYILQSLNPYQVKKKQDIMIRRTELGHLKIRGQKLLANQLVF